jgi:hypothetical protein
MKELALTEQAIAEVHPPSSRPSRRRPYRTCGPTDPTVSIALRQSLDHRARPRLARLLAVWERVAPMTQPAVAHIDMTRVTCLDPAGIDMLNEFHAQLTLSGWLVRVTPPADVGARVAFHHAAIRGDLRWA